MFVINEPWNTCRCLEDLKLCHKKACPRLAYVSALLVWIDMTHNLSMSKADSIVSSSPSSQRICCSWYSILSYPMTTQLQWTSCCWFLQKEPCKAPCRMYGGTMWESGSGEIVEETTWNVTTSSTARRYVFCKTLCSDSEHARSINMIRCGVVVQSQIASADSSFTSCQASYHSQSQNWRDHIGDLSQLAKETTLSGSWLQSTALLCSSSAHQLHHLHPPLE